MKYILLISALISATCFAGLPPTTSKGIGDSNNVTTFNFQFPNFAITHTGVTSSLGTLSVGGGGTGSTGFTAGSVPYSNGTILTQDNKNLFWDATNKRMGIGTAIPLNTLSVSKEFYNTGTASQSTTTITGSGTAWDATAIGTQFIFADGTDGGTITAFTDATHITSSKSQTVGSQAYSMKSMGLQVTGGSLGTAGSQGLVGIGVAVPSDTLHIQSTSNGWTEILFDSSLIPAGSSGPGGTWNMGTGYTGYGNIKNFYIDDAVNGAGTAAFVIDSTGRVGLTNMSPIARLDVNGYVRSTGNLVTTSTLTRTSSTALTTIAGLSATVGSGLSYQFEIVLFTTSGSSGGIKVDLGAGSATMTSIIGDAVAMNAAALSTQTRVSALTTSLCAVTAVTAAVCTIKGTMVVNAGGSFIPRFAQNASNGTSSTVAIGSYMKLTQL